MVDEKFTKLVQDILGPETYATRKDNIYTGGEYFKICSPHGSVSIMLDNYGKHIKYQMHPVYTGVLNTSDLQSAILLLAVQFASVVRSGSTILSTGGIDLCDANSETFEEANS